MNDDILLIDLETLPAGQPTELFPGFATVGQAAASIKKKRRSALRKKPGQETVNDSEPSAISGDTSGTQTVSGDMPLSDVSGIESIKLHQALPVDVFVNSRESMPDSSTKSPETNQDSSNMHLSGVKIVSPERANDTRKGKGKRTKKLGKSLAQHYRDVAKARKEFMREDLRVPTDVFSYVQANVGEGKTFPSKQAGYISILRAGFAVFSKGKTN